METTTTSTSSTAATATTAITKRPMTLTIGAVILVLAALLSLASPFVPRGRGFIGAGGARPAGARQAGQNGQIGQGGGAGGGTDQGGAAGGAGGGFGGGAGGGAGGGVGGGAGAAGGAGGAGGFAARAGANATLFRLVTPVHIAEGVIGGLFTLLAAWGIWKRKKWGMTLALIAAAVMLVTGAVSVFLPLVTRSLGRTAVRALGSLTLFTTFITSPQWIAIVGMLLAVVVAVLVLLPASRKGYIVKPRERRVM